MEETVNAQQLKNRIAVLAGEPESMERAAELAERLGLPLIDDREHACKTEFDLFLVRDRQGLSLQDQQGLSIRGDFTRMLPRLRQANLQNEFLVKASRLKGLEGVPYAVDATAGLGEDSLILAAAGFQVDLYEHNPIIAELLADALERAAGLPELAETVSRMRLHRGSSLEERPDQKEAAAAAETGDSLPGGSNAPAGGHRQPSEKDPDQASPEGTFPGRRQTALFPERQGHPL